MPRPGGNDDLTHGPGRLAQRGARELADARVAQHLGPQVDVDARDMPALYSSSLVLIKEPFPDIQAP
jgi:hypothetical protein